MKNVLDSDWQEAMWLKGIKSANLAYGGCSRSTSGTQNRDVFTKRRDTGATQREGLGGVLTFFQKYKQSNLTKRTEPKIAQNRSFESDQSYCQRQTRRLIDRINIKKLPMQNRK